MMLALYAGSDNITSTYLWLSPSCLVPTAASSTFLIRWTVVSMAGTRVTAKVTNATWGKSQAHGPGDS